MRELDPQFIRVAEAFFHVRRHKKAIKGGYEDVKASPGIGWKRLGAGCYGEAWEHADWPGLVLKISGPMYWGYDSRDVESRPDAWPILARHAMAHPSPHLPNIMHFVQYNARMAWGIMPKYIPCNYIPEDAMHVQGCLNGDETDEEWLWPLQQMCQALDLCVDLHSENVMLDHDGTYIITDPFTQRNYGES
ncbi:MAG TPA: hypothetical protein VM783_18000 [Candidatus Acidoferrum sp.]|nr:hypothetical protein [Candidatus Acidoferrum sp.]